MTGDGQR